MCSECKCKHQSSTSRSILLSLSKSIFYSYYSVYRYSCVTLYFVLLSGLLTTRFNLLIPRSGLSRKCYVRAIRVVYMCLIFYESIPWKCQRVLLAFHSIISILISQVVKIPPSGSNSIQILFRTARWRVLRVR